MDFRFSHTLISGRADFPSLLDALEAHLLAAGAPMSAVSAVMIATDELVSNVLDHGSATRVSVAAEAGDGMIVVEVADDGIAFDPLAAGAPDTSASLDDRDIGGLGIHLVRTMMDEMAYTRMGDLNQFRFSKRYSDASASPDAGDKAS